MKNYLPGLLIFLCIGTGYAQKCKYQIDKVDAKTSEVERRSDIKLQKDFTLNVARKGEAMTVGLTIIYRSEQSFIVPVDAELTLELVDASTLTLKTIATSAPKIRPNGTQVMSTYKMHYACSKAEMEQIASQGAGAVRATVNGKAHTFEVKKPADIAAKATCMLQQ